MCETCNPYCNPCRPCCKLKPYCLRYGPSSSCLGAETEAIPQKLPFSNSVARPSFCQKGATKKHRIIPMLMEPTKRHMMKLPNTNTTQKIKADVLYTTMQCSKRNGLQDEYPKWYVLGKPHPRPGPSYRCNVQYYPTFNQCNPSYNSCYNTSYNPGYNQYCQEDENCNVGGIYGIDIMDLKDEMDEMNEMVEMDEGNTEEKHEKDGDDIQAEIEAFNDNIELYERDTKISHAYIIEYEEPPPKSKPKPKGQCILFICPRPEKCK